MRQFNPYVMHNKTLCIKQSYLNRFFGLPKEITNDFVTIKKGLRSSTSLLRYKSLPVLVKRMIFERFGAYEKLKFKENKHDALHNMQVRFYNNEIRKFQKEIHNLKLQHNEKLN